MTQRVGLPKACLLTWVAGEGVDLKGQLRLLTCLVRPLEVLWHLDEQVRRPRQPTSLPITLVPSIGAW